MSINKKENYSGFTLIEMAVVLVIVGVLMGSFIGSVSSRIETTRRNNTMEQLDNITSALLGFASVQGRLPCPTTTTNAGREAPVGGGACTFQHGFIPGRTLGIHGTYNLDGLLTDSWGNPIRYSVATANGNTLTTPGGIALTTMAVFNPKLIICDGDSTQINSCAGAPAPTTLSDEVPFVVLSLGNDGASFVAAIAPNSDQGENAGEAIMAANAAGENLSYTVAGNRVFVSKSYSDVGSNAGGFDDLIVWVSKYVLYSRMIETEQLP